MQNKPVYAIASVDHALRLAVLLQQEGPMRITDAAERLQVSTSTAHRLLAMLVYRGFAEQRVDRLYQSGSILRTLPPPGAPVGRLRLASLEPLNHPVALVEETASLVIMAGTKTRFVATVECSQILRVGDRAARELPAHLTSGGRAMMALLDRSAIETLYADEPGVDLDQLRRKLATVRRAGFAINHQNTEVGLTAVATALRDGEGRPIGAVAIAMPSVRFRRDCLAEWVAALNETVRAIEGRLLEMA